MSERTREIERAVIERLEPYRDDVVAKLRQIIGYEYQPQVGRIHFEVQCDQFANSFPVNVFYLDQNDDDCPTGDGAAFPDIWDLVETDGVLDEEFLEQAESDYEDVDTLTASGMALIAWFADCWQVAGGRDFALKASIRLHDAGIYDEGRYFNLVAAKWERGG